MEKTDLSRLNAAERAERARLRRFSGWWLLYLATLLGLLGYDAYRAAQLVQTVSFPAQPLAYALEFVPLLLLLISLALLLARRYAFRMFFFAYALLGALSFFGAVFFDFGVMDYAPFLALAWLPYLLNADRVRVFCGLSPSGEAHAPHGDEPAAVEAAEFAPSAPTQPGAPGGEVGELSSDGGEFADDGAAPASASALDVSAADGSAASDGDSADL